MAPVSTSSPDLTRRRLLRSARAAGALAASAAALGAAGCGTPPYATGATMPELSTWLAGDGAFKPEHYKQGVATVSNFDSAAVADGMQLQQDLVWKHRV